MKQTQLLFIVLTAALLTACASRQAKTDSADTAPATKSTSAKDAAKQPAKQEAAAEGEIVGKPAAGSKFSKLKLGMTLKQVEKLIGPPTKQWQRPTGKAHIPFYFGDDRWALEYAYSKEGQLTFNYGGEQLLVRIAVDKNQ